MPKRWLLPLAVLFAVLHLVAFIVASDIHTSQWTEKGRSEPDQTRYRVAGGVARILFFPASIAGGCLYAFPIILLLNSVLWGVTLALLTKLLVRLVGKPRA